MCCPSIGPLKAVSKEAYLAENVTILEQGITFVPTKPYFMYIWKLVSVTPFKYRSAAFLATG